MATPWTQQIRPVKYPAALTGQRNGAIDGALLDIDLPYLKGKVGALLKGAPSRSYRAMYAKALADGIELKSTNRYRDGDRQVSLFLERYVLNASSSDRRYWDGKQYGETSPGVWVVVHRYPAGTYGRVRGAAAAVPYTSNHGRAIADDMAAENDGDPGPESMDSRTLAWLEANAWDFGWSWELPSEMWHLRYCLGDAVTAAVLDYESGGRPAPEPPSEEDDLMKPVLFGVENTAAYAIDPYSGRVHGVFSVELLAFGYGSVDAIPDKRSQDELDATLTKSGQTRNGWDISH